MPRRYVLTVPMLRLAAELRELRKGYRDQEHDNGLTREEVAERTGINEATLYRLETGRAKKPQKRTLEGLFDLYGVEDPLRSELLNLPKEAAQSTGVHAYRTDLSEEYVTYLSFEEAARSVRNYQSLFIPGPLQTADYAWAVVRAARPTASRSEIQERVDVRMGRHEHLTKQNALHLWVIVDEAALHRVVGGRDVMRAQLEYLLEAVEATNVTFQVIPFDKGEHAGMPGSFVILDFDDPAATPVVYVDSMGGDVFLSNQEDVRQLSMTYDHLRAEALSPNESKALVRARIEAL